MTSPLANIKRDELIEQLTCLIAGMDRITEGYGLALYYDTVTGEWERTCFAGVFYGMGSKEKILVYQSKNRFFPSDYPEWFEGCPLYENALKNADDEDEVDLNNIFDSWPEDAKDDAYKSIVYDFIDEIDKDIYSQCPALDIED